MHNLDLKKSHASNLNATCATVYTEHSIYHPTRL